MTCHSEFNVSFLEGHLSTICHTTYDVSLSDVENFRSSAFILNLGTPTMDVKGKDKGEVVSWEDDARKVYFDIEPQRRNGDGSANRPYVTGCLSVKVPDNTPTTFNAVPDTHSFF
jgi:hypothetical protein